MIAVCGTETSATIRWSPKAVPLPRFPECGRRGGCHGYANRDRGSQWQFKLSNLFACPLNPFTPHSATQWGEECSGVITVPLISVLQTRSSQIVVFKIEHEIQSLKNLRILKIYHKEQRRKKKMTEISIHIIRNGCLGLFRHTCWGIVNNT